MRHGIRRLWCRHPITRQIALRAEPPSLVEHQPVVAGDEEAVELAGVADDDRFCAREELFGLELAEPGDQIWSGRQGLCGVGRGRFAGLAAPGAGAGRGGYWKGF